MRSGCCSEEGQVGRLTHGSRDTRLPPGVSSLNDPQLRICLLIDGAHACGPVFRLCRDNGWAYLITFKEGSARAVFADYEQLKAAAAIPIEHQQDGVHQTYWWVNDLEFSGERV